jgi:hypothetical protein
LRFFLDNCLSPHYAKALDSLSLSEKCPVFHLSNVFNARNIPDEQWLPELSKQGDWVIVSGDMRIFKSPLLRQIWIESRMTTFFLGKGWMNQSFWEQAWWLVRWWPHIIEQAKLMEAGTGFEIPAKSQGKFKLLNPSP